MVVQVNMRWKLNRVVDTLGHVTAFTKQSIRTGSTTVTGLLQLATGTELTSALSTTKATPSAVKTTVIIFQV